jgi:4,5-dihydroxyphthalate decarboxylase
VAQSLYKAMLQAKQQAFANLYDSSALRFMLPWLNQDLEQATALLGEDYWSYGLDANVETLATLLRYHHDQGLSRRLWRPDELFAPESTESFVI